VIDIGFAVGENGRQGTKISTTKSAKNVIPLHKNEIII
jgi:hypothetical protein